MSTATVVETPTSVGSVRGTTVVRFDDQDKTQAVVNAVTPTLAVVDPAIGPKGDKGDKGDPGTLPLSVLSFVSKQNVPDTTWTIRHALPYFPAVTTVDSSGRAVEGDVVYVDATTITVTFSAPFGGVAYLS